MGHHCTKPEWKARRLILFWASCRENKRWNERGVEKFWEDTSLCDLVSCRQRVRKKVWGIELFDHSLERGQVPPFILPLSQKQTKEFTLLCKQQNMSKRGWANIMVQRFFSTSLDKDVLEEGALFLLLHKRCLFRQECLEPFNRYAQDQAWNGKWKVTSLWSAIRKNAKKPRSDSI